MTHYVAADTINILHRRRGRIKRPHSAPAPAQRRDTSMHNAFSSVLVRVSPPPPQNVPSSKTEHQVECGFLLDVVVRKGSAIFELLTGEDETLLVCVQMSGARTNKKRRRGGKRKVSGRGSRSQLFRSNKETRTTKMLQTARTWWDAFLVLDLGLHVLDRVGWLDLRGGKGESRRLRAANKAEKLALVHSGMCTTSMQAHTSVQTQVCLAADGENTWCASINMEGGKKKKEEDDEFCTEGDELRAAVVRWWCSHVTASM